MIQDEAFQRVFFVPVVPPGEDDARCLFTLARLNEAEELRLAALKYM
jgi:hypothetical protein